MCGGSLGAGILLVSAVVRLALLPLTLRTARRAHERRKSDGLLSLLVQMPLLGAVFAAVRRGVGVGIRFLWIGNLARPDVMLVGFVASLNAAIVATAPRLPGQPTAPNGAWIMSAAFTAFFLWSASSAVALSAGASSVVSLLQNWILSRDRQRHRQRAGAGRATATRSTSR